MLRRFWADEGGATAIEYGLIAALIFLAILVGVGAMSNSTVGLFDYISNRVNPVLANASAG